MDWRVVDTALLPFVVVPVLSALVVAGSALRQASRLSVPKALKAGLLTAAGAETEGEALRIEGRYNHRATDILIPGGALLVGHDRLILAPSGSPRYQIPIENIDRLVLRTFAHWRRLDIFLQGGVRLRASFIPQYTESAERKLANSGFPFERRRGGFW